MSPEPSQEAERGAGATEAPSVTNKRQKNSPNSSTLIDDREQERMGALNVEITTYLVLKEKGGKMGQKKGQKYLNILCD